MVYNTIQHPHPPHTVCIHVYCTFSLGRKGEEAREKVEGQEYTVHKYNSFVRGDNQFSQGGLKIPTMSECIYSL
jgi:hypothetical protein